jgi:hypothetical protein
MDKKWRKGSKQFVDFVLTLTDPLGDLTLEDVEGLSFQVLVSTDPAATPARDDEAWTDPSVAKVVTEVGASFKVAIMHLYETAATGPHNVFVKFGPTPEEPIYLAASFLVL